MARFVTHPTAYVPFWLSLGLIYPSVPNHTYATNRYLTATHTATAFEFKWDIWTGPGEYWGPLFVRFSGAGFTYDSSGYPTGGTYTVARVYASDHTTVLATLSSVSLPLAQVFTVDDAAVDVIFAGNDVINGGPSREWFRASTGTDVVNGGGGIDVLEIDRSASVADESVSVANPGVVQHMSDGTTIVGIEVIGIRTGSGDDTLTGGDGGDVLVAGEGNNSLTGGAADDWLYVGSGNDTMIGGSGDDHFDTGLGLGIKHIDGGSNGSVGDVVTVIDKSASTLNEVFSMGDPSPQTFSDGTTVIGIERVMLLRTGSGNDTLTGTAWDDEIHAGDGDNHITGGDGRNDIFAGSGNDTIYGGGGIDDLEAGDGNNEVYGGDGNDSLIGGSGNDTFNGGGGDDYLYCGTGVDHIDGGSNTVGGDDPYALDHLQEIDKRTSTANEVFSNADPSILQTLSDGTTVVNVEWITTIRTGSGNDTLTGGLLANFIWSGAGNDVVDGGAGSDDLMGEDGDDLLLGGAGDLDALMGMNGNDTMDGGEGVDFMMGMAGDDVFYSRDGEWSSPEQGTDWIDGGEGTDTAIIDRTSATIGLYLSVPEEIFHDEGERPGDYDAKDLASIERLEFTGGSGNDTIVGAILGDLIAGNAGNDRITSGGGADTLDGGLGNDTLNGGAGIDSMTGGDGDDIYYVNDTGDVARETSAAGGMDRVISTATFTLGANVENLTLSGSAAINGTGNASANVIVGNSASNVLNGRGGADRMYGGDGDDTYYVDNAGDVTIESSAAGGMDRVISSVTRTLGANLENLTLSGTADINGSGNALANAIAGNAGRNMLQGGGGNDTLAGGGGNDTFVFNTVLDAAGNIDRIVGFSSVAVGDNDTIRLDDAIFTALHDPAHVRYVLSADQIVIGAGAHATTAEQHILYNTSNGWLSYDADGNGAQAAVRFAILAGIPTISNLDFVVI